ncbi:hypothetical protein BS78_09G153600 [Paspalum vaginatum]|uniref:Uncharacterized protein n=1 Tax=Paspalum vaginatum TaxID=158149 RepID=A0A9W7X956_9POAL|nr:hypothetical protein BS78_K319800 [Paspalum vaginatum]KAJ1263034.1 hypothetical protein BS78_09G153600 [Paspalum vaginatum]
MRASPSSTGGSTSRDALVASAWLIVLLGSAPLAASDEGFPPPPPTAVPAGPPLPAPAAAALLVPVAAAPLPRKILRPPGGVAGEAGVLPSRMDEGCSGAEDIAIYQGHASSLPSGVPAYKVDVVNRCLGGLDGGECAIAGIHIRCGWFSSASLVDPSKFRRLGHDDCLLNDGRPLLGGETVSFEYANSFPYPLTVRLATCVDPTASP